MPCSCDSQLLNKKVSPKKHGNFRNTSPLKDLCQLLRTEREKINGMRSHIFENKLKVKQIYCKPKIQHEIIESLAVLPEIDLFASRLKTQLPGFVSWKPDPESCFVDAFTIDWGRLNFYAFANPSWVPCLPD